MVLIQSLREAPRLLRERPILFVPMAMFAILQLPQLFLETLDPVVSLVGSLLIMGVFVLVTPAFYAGAIGMTNDAATDVRTSLGRFRMHVKEHYVSVLVAYLFITAVTFGFGIAIGFVAIVAVVAVGAGGGLPFTAVVVGVVALLGLAFLIALFAVHFYAHAIVIEGRGPIDGLSRSVHVVRRNLKPVLGYGLLSLVFGGGLGGAYGLLIAFAFPSAPAPGEPAPMPDLVPALLVSVGSVVGTTLFATFFVAFTVVFYRNIVDADGETTGSEATTAGRDVGGPDDVQASD